MKKNILFLAAIGLATILNAQARKPTLMVVPSDAQCKKSNCMIPITNGGQTVEIPDYRKALQSDPDMLLVIAKINTMMAERGFPLKNLESELKAVETAKAEVMALSSKGGESISESPIDILNRTAKADIIMQLTYTVNVTGPKKSVTFNLQGIDAYTNKQIAGAQGTGAPSFSAETPVLLEEAVLANMDNFSNTLQTYFDDLFERGRETTIQVKVWDSSPVDLDDMVDFKGEENELSMFIEDWIAQNAVQGRYSVSTVTSKQAKYEQVRIPLFYERNGQQRAMDTRQFANKLRKFLLDEFQLESKVYTKGLGEAWIIVGDR
jgi:hypothetical protein